MQLEIYSVNGKKICIVEADNSWNICNLKKAISKNCKISVSRQSIRSEQKGKDVSDNTPLSTLSLSNGAKLYLKDLGPQIPWTAVFLLEYAGPLVVYGLFALRPRFIYGTFEPDLSTCALVALCCWEIHYTKRILETLFVHRFSHGTMPLRNLFKNCGYYWGFAAFVAYHVNHPLFTPPHLFIQMLGLAIFVLSEFGNLCCHLLLRDLRPPGTNIRKIPRPNSNPFTLMFKLVSCPNYLYEFDAWCGFTIMTSCLPAGLFTLAGMTQMTIWALAKHKNYRREFSDYPRGRKAIIPFII